MSWQSHALSEHELKLQAQNWNESRYRFLFADQNTQKYILPFEQIQEPSQWKEYEYTIGKRLWDVTHDAKNITFLFARKKTFGSLRLPINMSILYWHLVMDIDKRWIIFDQ